MRVVYYQVGILRGATNISKNNDRERESMAGELAGRCWCSRVVGIFEQSAFPSFFLHAPAQPDPYCEIFSYVEHLAELECERRTLRCLEVAATCAIPCVSERPRNAARRPPWLISYRCAKSAHVYWKWMLTLLVADRGGCFRERGGGTLNALLTLLKPQIIYRTASISASPALFLFGYCQTLCACPPFWGACSPLL